jgi:methylthioribose-1-phosphate isomerase
LVRKMRTLEWESKQKKLKTIDQRRLPASLEFILLKDEHQVAEAIRNMTLRGAPIIGVSAAFGLVLAAFNSSTGDLESLKKTIHNSAKELGQTRPTAINLAWALNKMLAIVDSAAGSVDDLRQQLEAEAIKMANEDVKINLAISKNGAELINDGDTIIHHCNTGALAMVDWGTALGVIRTAHEQGKKLNILVDETRPRLQGSRLTAWELQQYGIPYEIICDNAAGFFLEKGMVQKVLFGADRVVQNGDVANKIGSYMLALAANANNVPVYSVFPTSTVDLIIKTGSQIPIEMRSQDEVLDIQLHGEQVVPIGSTARNPAFDITPYELISGYVTEMGVITHPFESNILKAIQKNRS